MRIIKRDGSETVFEPDKIVKAIEGANNDILKKGMSDKTLNDDGVKYVATVVTHVCEELGHIPTVEEVQDLVQNQLMQLGKYDLATAYITYRYEHQQAREGSVLDKRVLAIVERASEEARQENSNKNVDVVSVQRDYIAGEVSRDLTRRMLITEEVRDAHDQGIIHFHDTDYFLTHEHNCFSADTAFVTDAGVKTFNDLFDGQQVHVIDHTGSWRNAIVHSFGKQTVYAIEMHSGRSKTTVKATRDHTWILNDGSRTNHLNVGDVLASLPELEIDTVPQNTEDARYFTYGFAIGDGCDHTALANPCTQIRLCGNKSAYADIFRAAGANVTMPPSLNGDLMVYLRPAFKQNLINGKAWRTMSLRQRQMLFCGYYAADGHGCNNRITTSDDRLAQLIRENSALAGFYISGETETVRDTPYKNNARLIDFHFRKSQSQKNQWIVDTIKEIGNAQVWCVTVEDSHSFTLAQGVVTGNCGVYNLEDMLQNGTVISGTMIEKPHSFSTACNIATQVIAQIASSSYGGQTFTLAHLAPFVDVSRKKFARRLSAQLDEAGTEIDDATFNSIVESQVRDEVRKGIQTIQYQLITLMTTNGQAPFVSVFMWLDEVADGQEREDLALMIEETIRQRYQGVKDETGHWITPAFPKLLYVLDEDNTYEGSKYFYLTKLAAKCTAKRLVPDYISAKKMRELKLSKGETPGNGDVYGCMGCRSFLTPDRSGNGFNNVARAKNYRPDEPKYYGRFNQGVVTINLPDVALSSGRNVDLFWKIFEERLELCHRALRLRHERLLGTPSDVAPILWQHGAIARLDAGEKIDPLLFGGYSTISLGYAGLYECVRYMTGKSHTEKPEGHDFGIAVMQKMNDKCAEWKAAENIDYSIYGTPIESTTYKFAKCLQRRFGIVEGITDHGYITNSYHVNVREDINAFDKLAFESEFQHLSPGGAISYVEVPDMQDNLEAVIKVMQFIYENIIYAELNTKSDLCEVCGFDGEIQSVEVDGKYVWECPKCKNRDTSKMHVARRTCGYIGTQFWNQGRTEEIRDRVMHL